MATVRDMIEASRAEGYVEGFARSYAKACAKAHARTHGEAHTDAYAQAFAEEFPRAHAKGVLIARRSTLRDLLRMKFQAAATDEILARLDTADRAALERCAERFLGATTIEEALG